MPTDTLEKTLEDLAQELLDAAKRFDPQDRASAYEYNAAGSVFLKRFRAEHPDGERVYWSDAVDLAKEIVDGAD